MSNAELLHVSPDWLRSAPEQDVNLPGSGTVTACGEFTIRTSNDIRSFAAEWPSLSALNELENASGYAFQCRDHLEIWLETIGRAIGVEPFFVTAGSKSGEPLMMIPLGVVRRKGLRILAFLDAGVSDYNAPLLFPAAGKLTGADVSALWQAIIRLAPPFDVALLEKMPEFAGPWRNPLHSLAAGRWEHSGHTISLDGSGIRDLEKRRDYHDSQRKRKRIAEIGELKFRIAQATSEIQEVFEIFVRQKSRRYMETLGTPGFDVPGQRAYYLALTQRLAGRGVILAYLEIDNEVIATAWCLLADRRLYYMMAAYEDGFFRRFSPGKLLLEELVGWSSNNGAAVFDLGIGDEAYKLRWRESTVPLYGAMLPQTVRGYAYVAGLQARQMLKHHLPPVLTRFVTTLRKR